jgi:hypothetical protein
MECGFARLLFDGDVGGTDQRGVPAHFLGEEAFEDPRRTVGYFR